MIAAGARRLVSRGTGLLFPSDAGFGASLRAGAFFWQIHARVIKALALSAELFPTFRESSALTADFLPCPVSHVRSAPPSVIVR
ncbi:MAG: hypothetical protein NTV51_23540 [Verrucomicrobia bacterium]|nr:hypothetical protein [Verrucomicrobiota bacterium]